MNWLILFYFPMACALVAWGGAWALRSRPCLHAFPLAVSRRALLLFPLLLMFTCLAKGTGPHFWSYWATPLWGREIVLGGLGLLISGRWLAEMIAKRAFEGLERSPAMARKAPRDLCSALGFEDLRKRLAPSRWLAWLPKPTLHVSKVANIAHLSGGLYPRIFIEASLVPEAYRGRDWWWESVPLHYDQPVPVLRAVVAHELGHFKHSDQLRKMVFLLIGALLPWEWYFDTRSLRKYLLTNSWLFRQWSGLMAWIGRPVRHWVREDESIKEALADEEADELIPDGGRLLAELRALYGSNHAEAPGVPQPKPGWVPPVLRHFLLLNVLGGLLWAAPGRIPYSLTLGSEMKSTTLPKSWCLVTAPGSEASAVFLPGQGSPGRIVIKCPKISLAQPPLLRAMGRILPDIFPGDCDVEMAWEVLYEGEGHLTGKEAFFSMTQSAMTVRPNPDPLTAYSLPREVPEGPANGAWRRYESVAKVRNDPALEHMLIGFDLSVPGKYIFKPPILTVVLPNGERQPFTQG